MISRGGVPLSSLLLRQAASQAQEPGERRISASRQPNRTELDRFVAPRYRTKYDTRVGRGESCFGGQAHSLTQRNEMHHGLASDVHLVDDRASIPIRNMPCHALAKSGITFGFSNNESLTPEILPINCPALCEKMAIGQRNEKAFGPKRNSFATANLRCVTDDCHIKQSPLDQRDMLGGWRTLGPVEGHARVLVRIGPEKLAEKACSHGRLNADAQATTLTYARRPCHSRGVLNVAKPLSNILNESETSGGDLQTTRAALEERYPKRVLERAHTAAHCRLPNPQLSCGTPEAQVVRNAQCPPDRYRVNLG